MEDAGNKRGIIGETVALVRRRALMSGMIRGTAWCLAAILGAWLALFFLDNVLDLPAGLRLPLAVGAIAVAATGLVKKILIPAIRKPRPEFFAVEMEKRFSVPRNLIINALQFERKPTGPRERFFVERTMEDSMQALGRADAREFWEPRQMLKWSGAAFAMLCLWMLYAIFFPRHALNAFQRYTRPLADIPSAGSLILEISPGSDVTAPEGGSLTVRAIAFDNRRGVVRPDSPPVIMWRDNVRRLDPAAAGREQAVMREDAEGGYTHSFQNLLRPLAFRVAAGDTHSRSIYVDVTPKPRLAGSLFVLTPPPYTALPRENLPGPPASVACLPGSALKVMIETKPPVKNAAWKQVGGTEPFASGPDGLTCEITIATAGAYEIEAEDSAGGRVGLAGGNVHLKTDNPPEIEFVTDNLNRIAAPGEKLSLEVKASDDYGIATISIVAAPLDAAQPGRLVKDWQYMGPPGIKAPPNERTTLLLDPSLFLPGGTYILTAQATDFNPTGAPGKSRPMAIRIRTPSELALPSGNSMEHAFSLLRETIAEQEKANGATDNLAIHAEEALDRQGMSGHRKTISGRQNAARLKAEQAGAEFEKHEDGHPYSSRLRTLTANEMQLVMDNAARLDEADAQSLPPLLKTIKNRQNYILAELTKLLGSIRARETAKPPTKASAVEDLQHPALAAGLMELKDDLKEFAKDQKRIIEQSRTLADQEPEDLTDAEEQILGELARKEAEWASFFEEKLTDFSKLPIQDFADGSISEELNEVIQDVTLAADALYRKAVEMAVPQEQSGLENAEELVNNLERWLADAPDRLKWMMEDPLTPALTALAELPSELEDIVGELLDKEEEMTDDVEDASSSWLDSIDKGAGWDAMDGPISSMSAKGVTGNLLPNEQEIGGRSGEGRTGRSHGQMVEETAAGKEGRNTPSRLTPGPFEQGSIKDESQEEPGGATGGGKLSGFSDEGLRGPTPPQMLQQMARLADRQSAIRQEAEVLALTIRQYNLPSGDLENAIAQMKKLEQAARAGEGLTVRQSFSRVMDSLRDTGSTVRMETGLKREQFRVPEKTMADIMTGIRDGAPAGYEEMVSAYYRALATRYSLQTDAE